LIVKLKAYDKTNFNGGSAMKQLTISRMYYSSRIMQLHSSIHMDNFLVIFNFEKT